MAVFSDADGFHLRLKFSHDQISMEKSSDTFAWRYVDGNTQYSESRVYYAMLSYLLFLSRSIAVSMSAAAMIMFLDCFLLVQQGTRR